jgi:DNA polymerase-3 subunit delta'
VSEPTIWDDVVGQPVAIDRLRRAAERPVHAYLFVGPAGSTKKQAARAFAALLLTGREEATNRDAELALRGQHPDIKEIERVGPAISKDQVAEIIHGAAMAPVEGDRKVLILHEFHLLSAEGAARLLKTIEEPPASTTFLILADNIPHDLITVSSRCARIDFRTITDADIAARLEADGYDAEAAAAGARAAVGNLDRARLLASDPALVERREAFAAVPRELDGSGGAVMRIVDDLLARIEAAAKPLTERQADEAAAVQEIIDRYGERGSGKGRLEERHKRELRRHRTDELRAGLTVIAGTYRDALVAGNVRRTDDVADAVTRLHEAMESLEQNPNESLLLQSLLWSLPSI